MAEVIGHCRVEEIEVEAGVEVVNMEVEAVVNLVAAEVGRNLASEVGSRLMEEEDVNERERVVVVNNNAG